VDDWSGWAVTSPTPQARRLRGRRRDSCTPACERRARHADRGSPPCRSQLDAALGALVFALENNHPVARIDELLWLDPVLIPYLVVFGLEGLTDLAEATQDFAFLQAPDSPM
jgi:hypothetical protein